MGRLSARPLANPGPPDPLRDPVDPVDPAPPRADRSPSAPLLVASAPPARGAPRPWEVKNGPVVMEHSLWMGLEGSKG